MTTSSRITLLLSASGNSTIRHNLLIRDATVRWSMEKKIYRGYSTETFKPKAIDLGSASSTEKVTKKALSWVPDDDNFLKLKWKTTVCKIKFTNGVYDMSTGDFRKGFLPEEKFFVQVDRDLPLPRVQAHVDAARKFMEDIFTPRDKAPGLRAADYDFKKMPLWQFVTLIIGMALSGTKTKGTYALIGRRNSGKGVRMTAIESAFEGGLC